MLSEVFRVSLDQLIKGDVGIMKEQINMEDQRQFENSSRIFGATMYVGILVEKV